MRYISTRGIAPKLNFTDALLSGLAEDGGLYVPEEFPQFSFSEIRNLRNKSYTEIAKFVLSPFIGDSIPLLDFHKIIEKSYKKFRHPAVAPILQTNPNEFICELFHGPTLAFKDIAMQLLGNLMQYELKRRKTHATIIGATSGDTGGAAIEAYAGKSCCDIFILFPHEKISSVQKRQMTTKEDKNVHAIAIEGNFDDCQSLVKSLFNKKEFREKKLLSCVNSINWARIMGQIVYYFSTAITLGAPDRPLSFTVPTGNFGDVFAGYIAHRMGLPIEKLIIATNENDILVRALSTGHYKVHKLIHTTSPSMDIQISSNFERLLFEYSGRDASWIRDCMDSLSSKKEFFINKTQRNSILNLFSAGSSSTLETKIAMNQIYLDIGYLMDPHTATALNVARKYHGRLEGPNVILSTAHPFKFPETVKGATGCYPKISDSLCYFMNKKEHYTVLPNDLRNVENYINDLRKVS